MDSIPSTSTTASSTSMDSQGSSSPTTTTTTTTTTTSNNKKPSLAQDTAWLQRIVSEFETAFVSKRFTAALQCCYAALKAISTPQASSDRRETRASNGGDDDADLMAAFGPTGENSRQLARPRSACDSFRLQALRHPSCATEAIYFDNGAPMTCACGMLLCLLLQVLRQLDRHDEYVAFVRVFYSHIRRAPVEVLYGCIAVLAEQGRYSEAEEYARDYLSNVPLVPLAAISESTTYFELMHQYGERFLLPDQHAAIVQTLAMRVLVPTRRFGDARLLQQQYPLPPDVAESLANEIDDAEKEANEKEPQAPAAPGGRSAQASSTEAPAAITPGVPSPQPSTATQRPASEPQQTASITSTPSIKPSPTTLPTSVRSSQQLVRQFLAQQATQRVIKALGAVGIVVLLWWSTRRLLAVRQRISDTLHNWLRLYVLDLMDNAFGIFFRGAAM